MPGKAATHANSPRPADSFDEYLRADFAPAAGFDFPSGDGNTDSGRSVYSVANGRVVFAEHCGGLRGSVVVIEHVFYENYERLRVQSLYSHLDEVKVRAGEEVRRRQLIATALQNHDDLADARPHVELLRNETTPQIYCRSSDDKDAVPSREQYAEPSAFIASHRALPVPQNERALVLVDQSRYKMRLYLGGRQAYEFDVSLGQSEGEKRVEGDNKTPKGMYFVVGKRRGEFPGEYGDYFGGHWIKINYPNRFDAARGLADGLITPAQESKISSAWDRRAPTDESTRLGGGIGFHGWAREWSNEGPRHLSWGCVVLHLSDISTFYDQIPEGAMVVIF